MKRSDTLMIIIIGNLMVNLPTTLTLIIIIFILSYFQAGWFLSIVISTFIGWYLWAHLLKKWVKWAQKKGIDCDSLYYLGRMGLINFTRSRISRYYEK